MNLIHCFIDNVFLIICTHDFILMNTLKQYIYIYISILCHEIKQCYNSSYNDEHETVNTELIITLYNQPLALTITTDGIRTHNYFSNNLLTQV